MPTPQEAIDRINMIPDLIRTVDFGPVFAPCRQVILQGVRDSFTSSTSPAGAVWPERKVSGDGHPLLIDTGELMQAATGGGFGHISRNDGRTLELGVSKDIIPYAGHDHGFPERNIPGRHYMGASEESLDACEGLISDFVLDEIIGTS